MDSNWIFLSAVGGFFIHFFKNQIHVIFGKIKNTVLRTVLIYRSDETYHIFEEWLFKNHENKYKNVSIESISRKETKGVWFRILQNEDFLIIRHKGKKIFITKKKEKIKGATSMFTLFDESFELRSFDKDSILDLIKMIITEHNERSNADIVSIYNFGNTGFSELFDKRTVKPLDRIILNKGLKKDLIDDLELFSGKREWYQKNGIFYKRNYLFYGPPGTGKTSLALAIASKLKRDVYIINLQTCQDLTMAIRSINSYSILLLEDIDVFFDKREKKNSTMKLDFSTLINFLDGAYSKEGLMTIVTTNHPEKLDQALMRPGRIDFFREIPFAEEDEIKEYLSKFFERIVEADMEGLKMPISKVQEICMSSNSLEKAIQLILKESKTERIKID